MTDHVQRAIDIANRACNEGYARGGVAMPPNVLPSHIESAMKLAGSMRRSIPIGMRPHFAFGGVAFDPRTDSFVASSTPGPGIQQLLANGTISDTGSALDNLNSVLTSRGIDTNSFWGGFGANAGGLQSTLASANWDGVAPTQTDTPAATTATAAPTAAAAPSSASQAAYVTPTVTPLVAPTVQKVSYWNPTRNAYERGGNVDHAMRLARALRPRFEDGGEATGGDAGGNSDSNSDAGNEGYNGGQGVYGDYGATGGAGGAVTSSASSGFGNDSVTSGFGGYSGIGSTPSSGNGGWSTSTSGSLGMGQFGGQSVSGGDFSGRDTTATQGGTSTTPSAGLGVVSSSPAALGGTSTVSQAPANFGSLGNVGFGTGLSGSTSSFGTPGQSGPGTNTAAEGVGGYGSFGNDVGNDSAYAGQANSFSAADPSQRAAMTGVAMGDLGMGAGYGAGVPSIAATDMAHTPNGFASNLGSSPTSGFSSGFGNDVTGDVASVDGTPALTVHPAAQFSEAAYSAPAGLDTTAGVQQASMAYVAAHPQQFGLPASDRMSNANNFASIAFGNMAGEGGLKSDGSLNIGSVENAPNGIGTGISQWTDPGRLTGMTNFVAQRAGIDPSSIDPRVTPKDQVQQNLSDAYGSFDNQVAYTLSELAKNYPDSLAAVNSALPGQLAQNVRTYEGDYENPKNPDSSFNARYTAALSAAQNLTKIGEPVDARVSAAGSPAFSSPTSFSGSDYANGAALGNVGSTPDGNLTSMGAQGLAGTAQNDYSVAQGAQSPTQAAQDAGFTNPAIATGVAAAAAAVSGITDAPGFVGKIANDPGYGDVRSALSDPNATPQSVAESLSMAMANDPSVISAALANGANLSPSALAGKIASSLADVGSAPTSSPSIGSLIGLGGLTGSPISNETGSPSFSFNGEDIATTAPTPYAPNTSLPATAPTVTVGPSVAQPAATPSLYSTAKPNKSDPIGTKAAAMGINMAAGAIPGLGIINGISSLLGGPNIGSFVAHNARPGTPGQVVGGGSSRAYLPLYSNGGSVDHAMRIAQELRSRAA